MGFSSTIINNGELNIEGIFQNATIINSGQNAALKTDYVVNSAGFTVADNAVISIGTIENYGSIDLINNASLILENQDLNIEGIVNVISGNNSLSSASGICEIAEALNIGDGIHDTVLNLDNITIDAGNKIEVGCEVQLPNIDVENIQAQVYYGKILDTGTVENIQIIPMKLINAEDATRNYTFGAKIELNSGGNYGYTFRIMPKHEMLLEAENMNLVKWITK